MIRESATTSQRINKTGEDTLHHNHMDTAYRYTVQQNSHHSLSSEVGNPSDLVTSTAISVALNIKNAVSEVIMVIRLIPRAAKWQQRTENDLRQTQRRCKSSHDNKDYYGPIVPVRYYVLFKLTPIYIAVAVKLVSKKYSTFFNLQL